MKKRLSLFMILVLLCVAPAASAQVFSPDALPLYSGIDVSAWQRAIDYQKVADSGVSMVYIRSSLGSDSVDEYFERNARGFSEAGVLVGYYHYLTARTPEAARHQARFFANLIQDKPMDLRPVMDFERVSGLSRLEIQAISRAFLEEVESRLNIRPALYASASGARTRYDASFAIYPLWVANYGVQHPEPNGHWAAWSGFQYEDIGRVDGIEGHVDLDHFTATMMIETPQPEPTATPRPTASPEPTATPRPTASLEPTATPRPTASPEPSAVPCARPQAYIVQKGDSLYRIARRFHTTVEELKRLNPLEDPNRIYTGQVIYLPG